jgi:hypothetical protein
MALTIEDLKPKKFTITVNGVELQCKPPRLTHILVISKIGEAFNNTESLDRTKIVEAGKDFDWVVSELLPELAGIELDMQASIDLLTQIMEQISPEENLELKAKGVSFDADPKAEKIG